jgi:transposase
MAYRYGEDRGQMMALPPTLDQYVSRENPVRAYDAFVDALDLKELGIDLDDRKVGNSEYDPKAMLKLLLYGYSYGVKSSRKLEREVHNNLSFIWLMKQLKPDHKTIAEFRRKNKPALKKALTLCARLCLKLDLIEGNVLFVDGSKLRANAGKGNLHKEKWYRDQLEEIEKRIQQILEESEQVDTNESRCGSFVTMPKELAQAKKLKESIKNALDEFTARGEQTKTERKINRVDPDSVLVKGRQGTHCGYNMQNVVDDKNGLIVHTDVVSESNDLKQLAPQIRGAEANLERKCEVACGDAGYWDITEIAKVESAGNKVVVPSKAQASGKDIGPFGKSRFTYDADSDCYLCPEGQRLILRRLKEKEQQSEYRIEKRSICRSCPHFGTCTSAKQGRTITRHALEAVAEAVSRRFEEPGIRQVYDRRKARIEHTFGFIKKTLGFGQFHLRGREGVRAEASILATCFNLRRMLTLLGGVSGFIAAMQAV